MLSINEIFLDYCESMKNIGKIVNKLPNKPLGGTSREVYEINNTALKLAYNEAGVAQNINEINSSLSNKYPDILANVLRYDPKNKWIEMELARPATEVDFNILLNVNYNEFKEYIAEMVCVKIRKERKEFTITRSLIKKLEKVSFIQKVLKFIYDTDAMPGDIGVIHSWGVVTRGNKEYLVLVDYGINYETYWKNYNSDKIFMPTRLKLKEQCPSL